jgi:hypothetical protein
MSDDFMFLPVVLLKQRAIAEIKKCNEYSVKYGLQLSDEQINLLIENRKESLEESGRIEFGGGILPKLILEFADSPYIYQDNYLDTLTQLQECFYYFKNESMEEISDDELIHLMKKYFDDECQGSAEYLQSTILENISRDTRYKTIGFRDNDGYEDDYTEFYEWDFKSLDDM